MNLTVTTEQRFARTPDGAVWTPAVADYGFWARYLEVFDQVRVVARIEEVPTANPHWERADGERLTFYDIPYYVGPFQYALKWWQVRGAVRAASAQGEAVILRVPGMLGSLSYTYLRKHERPFAVEVVGDPYEVFAPHVVEHPLRPFFRWEFSRQLRLQCREACAAAYVTERVLQRRYPPARGAFAAHYSSVELKEEAFVFSDVSLKRGAFALGSRRPYASETMLNIVTVGSLEQMYKAPDATIEAIAKCSREGIDVRLTIIGDGKYRAKLEAQAEALDLNGHVRFLGQLPAGNAVRTQLDHADLFVLPSRTEGLPRAMIEAMARGLPCIGSTAGGIPDLLPPEDMVPPNDVAALARKIREVASDSERMRRMSARNLQKSREYREEVLRERRIAFYNYVRNKTEQWLKP